MKVNTYWQENAIMFGLGVCAVGIYWERRSLSIDIYFWKLIINFRWGQSNG